MNAAVDIPADERNDAEGEKIIQFGTGQRPQDRILRQFFDDLLSWCHIDFAPARRGPRKVSFVRLRRSIRQNIFPFDTVVHGRGIHGFLQLFERPDLDLPDPFPRYAVLLT